MPWLRKCCVVGCNSNSETQRLFNFPRNDKLCELWLSFVTPFNNKLRGLSKSQLKNKLVCQKHFDRQQFDSKGDRLAFGYPCLFSDEEIMYGIPLSNIRIRFHMFPSLESKPERFKAWVHAIGGKLNTLDDLEYYRKKCICDRHFTFESKVRNNRVSALGLPSLYLSGSEDMHEIWIQDSPLHCDINPPPADSDTDKGKYSSYVLRNSRNISNILSVQSLTDLDNNLPGTSVMNTEFQATDLDHCYSKKKDFENDDDSSAPMSNNRNKKRKVDTEPTPTTSDSNNMKKGKNDDYELPSDHSYLTMEEEYLEEDVYQEDDYEEDDFEEAIDIAAEPIDSITEDENIVNNQDIEFVHEITLEKKPCELQHSDFKCNVCCGDIIGFRYVCLQCVDWDMCTSCEARGEHPEHYVLRLPAPTTQAEFEPVLAAIKQQIENLLERIQEESEIYLKEEPDVAEVTEEFDPDISDPFPVTTERNVPELYNSYQIATDYESNIANAINYDRVSASVTDYESLSTNALNSKSKSAPIIDAQSINNLKHVMKPFRISADQRILNAKRGRSRYQTPSEVNEWLREVRESVNDE